MQESFWWWQCSDRYITSLSPHLHTPFPPSPRLRVFECSPKWCTYSNRGMTGATQNFCRLGASSLCTINHAPCHFMRSHIRKVYACLAVTCHLRFWQNDWDLLRATAVTRGGGADADIRVSTESWPWRIKFSRSSCRDSNPRPFNHESGALTTELSRSPWAWSWWSRWLTRFRSCDSLWPTH